MGPRAYIGWAVMFASMIFFSTVLGMLLGEWKGTSRRTRTLLTLGLLLLLGSYVAFGYSGYCAKHTPDARAARLSPSFSASLRSRRWLLHFPSRGRFMSDQRIGFIGAGQMASALGQGFVKAGLASSLLASDPSADARGQFARLTGGRTTASNVEAATESDLLFLAVKPQIVGEVLAELRPVVGPQKLVVSIAAGIRLAVLSAGLGSGVRLVRVMPNTPCLVGLGACGYCLGPGATPQDGRASSSCWGPSAWPSR